MAALEEWREGEIARVAKSVTNWYDILGSVVTVWKPIVCRTVARGFTQNVALLLCATAMLFVAACSSTSSTIIPAAIGKPRVAIVPLSGPLGEQAGELISQELAKSGVAIVESSRVRSIVSIDTDLSPEQPSTIDDIKSYGDQLGVNYLFTGTVSAIGGPLYSYAHVKMTLRLMDVRSGQTRWIGNYGNALWSSAISTQGDLERGVKQLVSEFISSGGSGILES